MSSWRSQTLTLPYLRRSAACWHNLTSAIAWLRLIGVLPATETKYPTKCWRIKTDLNPSSINAEYLVASAAEWDSWGPSSPLDFIKAIEAECLGSSTHDLITTVLTTLGREAQLEAAA